MLVGGGECDAKDGAVFSGRFGQQSQTGEVGQHAEFKLKFVVGGDLEWHPLVELVFRNFDIEGLSNPLVVVS